MTAQDELKRKRVLLMGLLFFLLITFLISLNSGRLSLTFYDLYHSTFGDQNWEIWFNIRLSRSIIAILIGMALATSGVIMQGVFRNPLADAGLLGISSGSALFVGILIVFPINLSSVLGVYAQMAAAFVGGFIVCLIIYVLSHTHHCSTSKLLLAGIAINAITSSIIGILSYISSEQQLRELSLWSMGSLGKGQWDYIVIAATLIIPAIILSLFMGRSLNLLQLGDENAYYLGMNVQRNKRILLLLSALLIGTSVAISGVIAFIGLAVPHVLRLMIGPDHRYLIPATILGGGGLLLIADTLARTLTAAEIPVGLFTSLIGGPYFLCLILNNRRKI